MRHLHFLLLLFLISAALSRDDYLTLELSATNIKNGWEDTVSIEISLIPLNGFNAMVDLSASKGILEKSTFLPPIEGAGTKLHILPKHFSPGQHIISLEAKNGTTFLSVAQCTVTVNEMIKVSPKTSIITKIGTSALFSIQLTDYAKQIALENTDTVIDVNVDNGNLNAGKINLIESNVVQLTCTLLDEQMISRTIFTGENTGKRISVICTTSTGRGWIVYTYNNSSLPEDCIAEVAADLNNNIWVGTWSDGLFMFDGEHWKQYTTNNSPFPSNDIFGLYVDQLNNVWVSFYDYGVMKFDHTVWTTFNTSNSQLPNNCVQTMTMDAGGNVWFCCNSWINQVPEGGVARYDGTFWTIYDTSNTEIPSNNVTDIGFGKSGDAFIATWRGLAQFSNNTWTAFTDKGAYSLAVHEDVFWFGYDFAGIYKFENNSWTLITPDDVNLPIDHIYTICIDSMDNKWFSLFDLSSNDDYYGVAVYNDSSWKHFDSLNSTLPTNCVSGMACDTKGNMWFAAIKGLAAYGIFDSGTVAINNSFEIITPYKKENVDIKINQNHLLYSLDRVSKIRIVLFDLKGRKYNLVQNELKKAGTHYLNLHKLQLAKGVYLVHFESNNAHIIKKYYHLR